MCKLTDETKDKILGFTSCSDSGSCFIGAYKLKLCVNKNMF